MAKPWSWGSVEHTWGLCVCRFWRWVLVLVRPMTLLVTLSKAFDLSKPLQQAHRFKSTYIWHHLLSSYGWMKNPDPCIYCSQSSIANSGTFKVYLRRVQSRDCYNHVGSMKGQKRGLRKHPSTSKSRAFSMPLSLKQQGEEAVTGTYREFSRWQ